MRRILYYIQFCTIGSLIWCILYEKLSVNTILTGLLAGFLAVVFADGFLIKDDRKRVYYINPLVFIWFIVYILYSIYKAGIKVIPSIISGKTNVSTVRIKTNVDKGLLTSVIANSITLTPGTVTIDKMGNQLVVLWMDVKTKDPNKAGEIIKGKMEKILLKRFRR